MAWLDAQVFDTLYLTTITIAEMGFGLACLPQGRRRDALEAAFAQTMNLFAGRILPLMGVRRRPMRALPLPPER
jgi:hypothetical protein